MKMLKFPEPGDFVYLKTNTNRSSDTYTKVLIVRIDDEFFVINCKTGMALSNGDESIAGESVAELLENLAIKYQIYVNDEAKK